MDNKKSYVYKITCKITGEFYFGSSFNAKSDRYWGSGRKIKERIAKFGKENFVKEIIGEFDDRTESHRVENEYIEQFRHDDKCLNKRLDYHFGAYGEESRTKNSTAKRGEKNPMYGKIFSEEARAKMSASLKGLMSGENNPMYGKHHTDEARAKMSASLKGLMSGEKNPMYGKHHTDDTRAKLSAARLGKHWRKNPVTGKREYYD